MSDELKPCPVCGKHPDKPVDATKMLGIWRIIHRCPIMGFMETSGGTLARATERWNTRAYTPPPSAGARGE